MRILTLKLGEKTYMSGKITAFISKEALKIQREALLLGAAAENIKSEENAEKADLQVVGSTLDAIMELNDRKVWLICEAYGNKFTPDELEKKLAGDEIDAMIGRIITVVSEVVQKN